MTDILKIKTTDGWKGISVMQGDVTPIQSDWEQDDNSKLDFIKNRPEKLSDFTDDTATNPIDKAYTLTGLSASVLELNYCEGVTSDIQTQLDCKAGIDLEDTTNVGDIKMAHNSMPSWDTYIDLTLGASGAKYIAPADGYFLIDKIGLDQQYLYIGGAAAFNTSASGTQGLCATIPVRKGQEISISYNATGVTNNFKFIYAVGSESEAE